MSGTVKETIRANKAKQEEKRKKEQKHYDEIGKLEDQCLKKAREFIRKSLDGFNIEEGTSVFGDFFLIVVKGRRNVYIVYKYRSRKVKYSDEMDAVDKRSLSIGIGFSMNEYKTITSVESFIKDLTHFLTCFKIIE